MQIKEGQKELLKYYVFDNRTNAGIFAADDIAEAILACLADKDVINIIFAAAPSQNDTLGAVLI